MLDIRNHRPQCLYNIFNELMHNLFIHVQLQLILFLNVIWKNVADYTVFTIISAQCWLFFLSINRKPMVIQEFCPTADLVIRVLFCLLAWLTPSGESLPMLCVVAPWGGLYPSGQFGTDDRLMTSDDGV